MLLSNALGPIKLTFEVVRGSTTAVEGFPNRVFVAQLLVPQLVPGLAFFLLTILSCGDKEFRCPKVIERENDEASPPGCDPDRRTDGFSGDSDKYVVVLSFLIVMLRVPSDAFETNESADAERRPSSIAVESISGGVCCWEDMKTASLPSDANGDARCGLS